MANELNQLNLTVVALVALVAIVGLVALVMSAAHVPVATGSKLTTAESLNDSNTAGQSICDVTNPAGCSPGAKSRY